MMKPNPYDSTMQVAPDPAVGNVIVESHGSELRVRFKPAYFILSIFILGTALFGFMTGIAWIKLQHTGYTLTYAFLTVAEALAFVYYARKSIRVFLKPDRLLIAKRLFRERQEVFDLVSLEIEIRSHKVRGFEFFSLQLKDRNRQKAYALQGPRRFTDREARYLCKTIQDYQASQQQSS